MPRSSAAVPIRLVILLTALVAAVPASAQSIVGHWVLKADRTNLFAIDVSKDAGGLVLSWRHPEHFVIDGHSVDNPSGTIKVDRSQPGLRQGDETAFVVASEGSNAVTATYILRAIDASHLAFRIVGLPTELSFERVPSPAKLGPFVAGAHYDFTPYYPTSGEMTALFDADQADRKPLSIDWSVVGPADTARRARTQILIDAGALASGADYYHAAFIFQHGDKPADFLRAHVLATVAAARGYRKAAWISAATLDRYLQAIERPQIFGTQFQGADDGRMTQGDYDRSLVSDALRNALDVPKLADQERQRIDFEQRSQTAKNN